MADQNRIRKDYSLCSDRHKRRLVRQYVKRIKGQTGQGSGAELIINELIPTQSPSLQCENFDSNVHISDNEGNCSQEEYESCNEVLSESDAEEEEVDPLLDEINEYYHCIEDHDSSSD